MPLLSGPPPEYSANESSCRKCNKEFNILFSRSRTLSATPQAEVARWQRLRNQSPPPVSEDGDDGVEAAPAAPSPPSPTTEAVP